MTENKYETTLYPEDPIQLKIFNYSDEELQERLSNLLDQGYKLSQHYIEESYLQPKEIKERINGTKKEIGVISAILTPEETFQPVKNQLKRE